MARMSPPRLEEKLVPLLSDPGAARLLKSCIGADFAARRDLAILRLFMATGIRLAEMAGLQLDDVDLDERTAIVTGKGRRTRIVRFDPETARALDRYLRVRDRERGGRRPQLWLGEKGRGPLGATGIYQMLGPRAERLGIEVHPHQFRHTFAHKWLSNGGAEGEPYGDDGLVIAADDPPVRPQRPRRASPQLLRPDRRDAPDLTLVHLGAGCGQVRSVPDCRARLDASANRVK